MARIKGGEPFRGEDAELERSVLAYLGRHPEAADTLQGIVDWWLPRQRYETASERIEQMLGVLVERGRLRTTPLPNGDVLFALNKSTPPSRQP